METRLGLDIENMPFVFERDLPLYISGNYSFKKVSIAGFECVLMKPDGDMGNVESIQKHLAIVKRICGLPVAIEPDKLSSFRRDSFLDHGIPFVTEKQVFLPFMGTYLESMNDKEVRLEHFTSSAQVALIKWLLEPAERIRIADLMDGFDYTTMTESRVAKQLGATECFEVEKDGTANVLAAKYPAKETFLRLKNHMVSPVETTGYIDLPTDWDVTIAGTEALSERTMVNPDNIHTYAVFGVDRKALRSELIDSNRQAYVEIWKYAPKKLLQEDGFADPISIALSLEDTKDERIETAVEEMLEQIWG